jgi:hypothetical protein
MANQLDRLLEGVSENASVHASVARLIRNIAAEAEHAGMGYASAALGGSLNMYADHIASHVLANTPVIAATPPVHAVPAHPHEHAEKPVEDRPSPRSQPTSAGAREKPPVPISSHQKR